MNCFFNNNSNQWGRLYLVEIGINVITTLENN